MLLALALLLVPRVAPGVEGVDGAGPEALLEAELEAARGRDLYLVLDPAVPSLEVRARGMTLHTVPLEGVTLLVYRPLRGAEPELSLPRVLTVAEEPEDPHRKRIAPPELQPFEEEDGEDGQATQEAADAPPDLLPDPPASYEVGLEEGWELLVTPEPPGTGLLSRLGRALADGWARLWRRPVARPPLLVLEAAAEEGRRLHHLFREGTRILVVSATGATP